MRVYEAGAVRDAAGVQARPGLVAVEGGQVVFAGPPEACPPGLRAGAPTTALPRMLLLPGLVNAHAHLDLTDLGPQRYTGDFAEWLLRITELRRDPGRGPEQSAAAVHRGLEQSRAAGVFCVGDIAGTVHAAQARLTAPEGLALPGVTYLECFGIGRAQMAGYIALMGALGRLPKLPPAGDDRPSPVRLGVSPHAPYTAGLALYNAVGRFCAERELQACTHLAESPAEIAFVRDLEGPFADRRRALGKWDDTLKPAGVGPVEWLEPELRRGNWLVAHCNYVRNEDIHILAACRASVAYCPLASEYFGFSDQDPPHRYRQMLDAGVNVCLGTDSILCQPVDEEQPLGLLPQMRLLYRRDRTDPDTLLRMATVNGLRAMDLPERLATLAPGAPANLVGLPFDPDNPADPLAQGLRGNDPVQVVCDGGEPLVGDP